MGVSNIHFFNLSTLFGGILLVVVLLFCAVVFAYDFCDVAVVYHPFGGDHLSDTLHFYHGYIAIYRRRMMLMTSFWKYNWMIGACILYFLDLVL